MKELTPCGAIENLFYVSEAGWEIVGTKFKMERAELGALKALLAKSGPLRNASSIDDKKVKFYLQLVGCKSLLELRSKILEFVGPENRFFPYDYYVGDIFSAMEFVDDQMALKSYIESWQELLHSHLRGDGYNINLKYVLDTGFPRVIGYLISWWGKQAFSEGKMLAKLLTHLEPTIAARFLNSVTSEEQLWPHNMRDVLKHLSIPSARDIGMLLSPDAMLRPVFALWLNLEPEPVNKDEVLIDQDV